jgi:hypothetical protein
MKAKRPTITASGLPGVLPKGAYNIENTNNKPKFNQNKIPSVTTMKTTIRTNIIRRSGSGG